MKKKARKEVKFKPPKTSLKEKIFKKLYSNEAEGLYLLVSFFPFFAGSWIAGGLVLDQLIPFIVVSVLLLGSNYGKVLLKENKIVFKKEFLLILAASTVGILFSYYSFTNLVGLTFLLGLSVLLFFLESELKNSNPRAIILKNISLIFRMSIYSFVGIMTQRFARYPNLVLEYTVFGFVPGFVLAGSQITKYTQVFLNHGWTRFKMAKNKKGEEFKKPGSIARLISSFAVIGPALPMLLTPFDLFPTPFLAIALVFTLIIKNLESYLNQEKPDAVLAVELANIALLLSFLVLCIGVIIRAGVV